jgi:death-on-curing family protein
LSRAYIEEIHDNYVKVMWPGPDVPSSVQYRNRDLLDSAVNRPFQTFGGKDLHASIFDKAAALFHSLVCNHGFQDGNKRTAVLAVHLFLAANDYALAIMGDKFRALAITIASHNEKGRPQEQAIEHLVKTFREQAVPMDAMRNVDSVQVQEVFSLFMQTRAAVRAHPLNADQEMK